MPRHSIRSTLVAAAVVISGSASLNAGGTRVNSVERYGMGGYIQPIGLHHGFHIESVTPDSAAANDHLKRHDIIVKIDGEAIRSLDHLRAVLAEAYLDDAEVTITYTRGVSLEHHSLKCSLKPVAVKPVDNKRRADSGDDTR